MYVCMFVYMSYVCMCVHRKCVYWAPDGFDEPRWAQDDDEDADEEEAKDQKKGTKKKKASKKQTKKVHVNKKNKGTAKAKAVASSAECTYKARNYASARKAFIAKRRKKGATYKDASAAWNASEARQKLLAGMSESELKRRRFVV